MKRYQRFKKSEYCNSHLIEMGKRALFKRKGNPTILSCTFQTKETVYLFLLKSNAMSHLFRTLFLCLFLSSIGSISLSFGANRSSKVAVPPSTLPHFSGVAGIDLLQLNKIDSIAQFGIAAKAYPGCQILIIKNGVTVYNRAFGTYTYDSPKKVDENTLYDIASLSKTTGTLLAVMKLYDDGRLKLTDRASDYLEFLRGTDKESITIAELLFHESGLPAGIPLHKLTIERLVSEPNKTIYDSVPYLAPMGGKPYRYKPDWVAKTGSDDFPYQVMDSFFVSRKMHDAAMQLIATAKLGNKVYTYSDVSFILLKEVVEKIAQQSLDLYLKKTFFGPMNLKNMVYLPLRTHPKEQIAPTIAKDFLRNNEVCGFVHDPDAAFLGGISGNAGLFATATDVAQVYQMLLNGGVLNHKRYLSEVTCQMFTTVTSANGRRGLGFDKPVTDNPQKSPCSKSTPKEVFGHTGYTGTCCWVDPIHQTIYVFLSNRTYPIDNINRLARLNIRTDIQEVIYSAMK